MRFLRAPLLAMGVILTILACQVQPAGMPVPGGIYKITLPVDTERASLAWLFLAISSDVSTITSIRLLIQDLECEALRAETTDYFHAILVSIQDGEFSFVERGVGDVKGRFLSDGSAQGTAKIYFDLERMGALTNFIVHDNEALCDLGAVKWTAEAPK